LFEFGIKKENENEGFLKNILYDPLFGRFLGFILVKKNEKVREYKI